MLYCACAVKHYQCIFKRTFFQQKQIKIICESIFLSLSKKYFHEDRIKKLAILNFLR